MAHKEDINKAAQLIYRSRKIIAFTGAGVSAESGISTYRDPGGLWDLYPEGGSGGILSVILNHPEDAPGILRGFLKRLKEARPNPGHLALVELEKMGYLTGVITQNIDNLHKDAGNSNVYTLHGNLFRFRCLACNSKKMYDRDEYFTMMEGVLNRFNKFNLSELLDLFPRCECGGNIRPDFVAFGEPVQDFQDAMSMADASDLMFVLGTSGVVYPAASIPVSAKSKGALLIEINPEKSSLTAECDFYIRGKTGVQLPLIVKALKTLLSS